MSDAHQATVINWRALSLKRLAYLDELKRTGRWKLCYYHGEPVELFDLASDPNEYTNLAGRPEYASLQEALTRRVLAAWDPVAVEADVRRSHRHRQIIGDVQFQVTSRGPSTASPVAAPA